MIQSLCLVVRTDCYAEFKIRVLTFSMGKASYVKRGKYDKKIHQLG